MDTEEKCPQNISVEAKDVHFRFKLEAGQCVNIDLSAFIYASVHSGNLHPVGSVLLRWCIFERCQVLGDGAMLQQLDKQAPFISIAVVPGMS